MDHNLAIRVKIADLPKQIPANISGYKVLEKCPGTYRMRSNYSRTNLSRMEDFTIFAVFIFADAQVLNIILHIYAIYVI